MRIMMIEVENDEDSDHQDVSAQGMMLDRLGNSRKMDMTVHRRGQNRSE